MDIYAEAGIRITRIASSIANRLAIDSAYDCADLLKSSRLCQVEYIEDANGYDTYFFC